MSRDSVPGGKLAAVPLPPPAPTRLSLLSPEVSIAVDPPLMRALIEACYAPAIAKLVKRDRLATARALWGRKVSMLLAERFDMLARLATPAGRDALVEAARDRHQNPAAWEEEHPAELAARLLADSIQQHAVLLRAHLRLLQLPPERATYELRAAEPRRVPEGRTKALAAALRAVDGAGDAWIHEDEDSGDLHAVVLYTARADALRFRVAEGRLAITAARPQLLGAYAAAFARALYDDARFFLDAPSVTLKPLQELGAAGLAAATERGKLRSAVPRVRVVACQLEAGDGHRVAAEGTDALARLAPHLRDGGHLARATVRVFVGGEERPVDCVVVPPHRLDVGWGGVARSGAPGPRVAREVLAALGLLSPGLVADDVTTLRPLEQPEWRWRELAGDDGWDAMCSARLVEEVPGRQSTQVSNPAHRRFGRGGALYAIFEEVTPLPGSDGPVDPNAPKHERDLVVALREATAHFTATTDYYYVPEDWSAAAFTVSQREMVTQRLSLGALLRKARREMGLERGQKPRGLPKGVLWVGEMRVEGGVVRFFYVVRAATDDAERAAIGRAVTRAAGFARAVVLVPRGRRLKRDFVELELGVREQLGAESWRGKVGEAVRALGIEKLAPAELVVPAEVRLVVDTRRERVLLEGVELVKLGENGYRLLKVLAENSGVVEMVPTRETDKAISPARQTPGATRKTVFMLRKWIASSFEAVGGKVPEDVKEGGLVRAVGRKGWTLMVRATVT